MPRPEVLLAVERRVYGLKCCTLPASVRWPSLSEDYQSSDVVGRSEELLIASVASPRDKRPIFLDQSSKTLSGKHLPRSTGTSAAGSTLKLSATESLEIRQGISPRGGWKTEGFMCGMFLEF